MTEVSWDFFPFEFYWMVMNIFYDLFYEKCNSTTQSLDYKILFLFD